MRLVRVQRAAQDRDFQDWSVQATLANRADQANAADQQHASQLTVAMDAVISAFAQRSQAASMEDLARELAAALLVAEAATSTAEVRIESHLWKHLIVNGTPHPTALMKGSDERQTTYVLHSRHARPQIRSGFTRMTVLHTEQSDALHRMRELTIQPEEASPLLAVAVDAEWTFTDEALIDNVPYPKVRHTVRDQILSTFAQHGGSGLHELLHAMAASAMASSALIGQLALRLVSKPLPVVGLSRYDASDYETTRSVVGHADQGRSDDHPVTAGGPQRSVEATFQREPRHG